jgi:plasmid maintenance system antidote protein VapI
MNTLEYLDACKVELGIESDYALAKALGVAQSSVSNYRVGRSRIDDDVALTIARILHIEPIVVIAHANAERAKTPEQKAKWMDVAEKISMSFRNLLSQWDGHERRASARPFMQ